MDPMHPSTVTYLSRPEIAYEYDDYFADSPLFAFDTTLLERWFPQPGRVIDVGCGTGRHVAHLARLGHAVTGVDLSDHMLRVAREKLNGTAWSAALVRADMMEVPQLFRPDTFDVALSMFSTLGLIAGRANRAEFLRGLAYVVKPGGHLAVHVHNRWHDVLTMDGVHALVANLWQTYRGQAEWGDKILWYYRGIRDMYVHVFSRRELNDLLVEAGWDVVDIVSLNGRRSGPLRLPLATSFRANGFIALARRRPSAP